MRAEEVSVSPDRVEVRLVLDPDGPVRTVDVPDIDRRAKTALPGLIRHRCTAHARGLFALELEDTELAHLFEHVALELMVLAGSPRRLQGNTTWDFGRDGAGVFRVSLEYDDDAVAVGAVRFALDVMRYLTEGGVEPKIDEMTARLEQVRGKGRDSS